MRWRVPEVAFGSRAAYRRSGTEQVALEPLVDAYQRDRAHHLVTSSVAAGARLAAGRAYRALFYHLTVLADVGSPRPTTGGVRAVAPLATRHPRRATQ